MDIVFINQWGRGGGVIWDLRIAEELDKLGMDVTFYIGTSEGGQAHPIDGFDAVEISTIDLSDVAKAAPRGVGGLIGDIGNHLFTRAVSKRLEPSEFDLIQINSKIKFSRCVDEWETPAVIKLNGPPYSVWNDVLSPFSSSSSCSQIREFDGVVTTGMTTRYVEEHCSIDSTVVNPGVDIERFSPDGDSIDWERPTVLFVGRFAPVKDLTELLDAFKIVQNEMPEAQLVLVGSGPLESRLKKYRDSLGLRSAVSFPGYVSNEEVPAYYRGADVFTISSKSESFGMVLLEALACETPVVAPHIDYIPELVPDEEAGVLYSKGDPDDLARSLLRFLENPDFAARCGSRGREIATQSTWEQRAKKLQYLYESLV